jgi:putative membrane protein
MGAAGLFAAVAASLDAVDRDHAWASVWPTGEEGLVAVQRTGPWVVSTLQPVVVTAAASASVPAESMAAFLVMPDRTHPACPLARQHIRHVAHPRRGVGARPRACERRRPARLPAIATPGLTTVLWARALLGASPMKTTRLFGLGVSLVLVACGNAQSAKTPQPMAPVMGQPAPVAAVTDSPGMSASDAGSATPPPGSTLSSANLVADNSGAPAPMTTQPPMSEEQVLGVVQVANTGEIEQGKLAQTKARDPRVKKLAAMMVKDHSEAQKSGMTVAKKSNLKPEPSPMSQSLQSDASAATTTLQAEMGADFDKGYVDTQVKEHQKVLDMIDQKLMPSATAADLKAYLTEVRASVSMHLQHAQDLQKEMQW